MAGSWTIYDHAALEISNAGINLGSDTFVMTLHTASYAPAASTDYQWGALSGTTPANTELATANGYTQGGVVLSKTNTLASGTVTWTWTAPTWASFSATFRYALITRRASTSLASTDLLLCYCDCTATTGGGGTLTINPNASGCFTITHTP